ncbi:hypothetical protein LTSEINV_6436 [Salmonella enterica subsp. enterica serovar Inverness str. R8-3668]|uniref:Uncharacterized protein n=1 Tax=Salmonella enterica subsp. enterica serovar Inverness str. R8-3668 TaxID=913075 RepID=G5NMQ5_SALET|nr:hypothetical protein LTSEINV_6436 [Salmonella enterica subsp. enterica serovar Inverness str. R8-3668]
MMKVSSPTGMRTSPVLPGRMLIFCEKVTILDLPLCITPDGVTNENVDVPDVPVLKTPANLF